MVERREESDMIGEAGGSAKIDASTYEPDDSTDLNSGEAVVDEGGDEAASGESASDLEALGEADESGDDYEFVELELSEEDIVRYLEDDEGSQIGFVVLEDGKEVEYLFIEDEADEEAAAGETAEDAVADAEGDGSSSAETPDDGSLGITRDGVQQATDDMNAIFKDGVKVAAEMKGAFDDIKSALDFSSLLK